MWSSNDGVVLAEGLTKSFGERTAVDGASIQVRKGDLLVLLGQNGSGKSTLLKMLATRIVPDRGRLLLFGSDDLREARRRIGSVFDHSSHWDALTGFENATFFARSYGLSSKEARARLDDLFQWIGLDERKDHLVSEYSLGMRRKLAIIEALAHRPEVLLMDEPSIGLDHLSRLALQEHLRALAGQGTAVIMATNDVHEASSLASRIVLLDRGKVIASSAPDVLIRSINASTKVRVHTGFPVSVARLDDIEGVSDHWAETGEGNVVTFLIRSGTEGPERVLSRILERLARERVNVTDIEIRRPDLGDVMLGLSVRV